ncbi:hypothetical protein AKAW_00702 [Aspergillus luchuensis IFO 4308]|nr:hypothetical protein AKAW_00702 [Aspergillus luchuensis IFO 4308]
MRRAPNVKPVPQFSGVLGPNGAAALPEEGFLAAWLGVLRTFWRTSSPQADPRIGTKPRLHFHPLRDRTISLSLRSARGIRGWSADPSTLGDRGGQHIRNNHRFALA